jgi:hypothetical protein
VIASHYAEPVERRIRDSAPLRSGPSDEGPLIRMLEPGEPFWVLDESIGWAWGYGGEGRRVGYVRSEALGS